MLGLGIGIVYQTEASPDISIGDSYGGGIVFYLDGSGGGLIASPLSAEINAPWGCQGVTISGADGTAIGTGNQNSIDINAGCTTADIAAEQCLNLSVGGYNDWYLPSKDELNEMFDNIGGSDDLGDFDASASKIYWSSTEASSTAAWGQNFADFQASPAIQTNTNKNVSYASAGNAVGFARAIRAF